MGSEMCIRDRWRSAFQKRRYARGMELVEERLTAVATACPGELGDACRATLSAGGKRVRPLLTLLCARRDMPLGEPVLRGATAIELLHMATLVHDDVLDRAELRRGRPPPAPGRRGRARRRGPGSPCAAARSP